MPVACVVVGHPNCYAPAGCGVQERLVQSPLLPPQCEVRQAFAAKAATGGVSIKVFVSCSQEGDGKQRVFRGRVGARTWSLLVDGADVLLRDEDDPDADDKKVLQKDNKFPLTNSSPTAMQLTMVDGEPVQFETEQTEQTEQLAVLAAACTLSCGLT